MSYILYNIYYITAYNYTNIIFIIYFTTKINTFNYKVFLDWPTASLLSTGVVLQTHFVVSIASRASEPP